MYCGEGALTGGQGGDCQKGLQWVVLPWEGVEAHGISTGVSDWLEEWQHPSTGVKREREREREREGGG